jgi:5-methyltetrahydrofolate--homocysteine methyltransferase
MGILRHSQCAPGSYQKKLREGGRMPETLLEELRDAVVEMKYEETEELTEKGLKGGLTAVEILNKALIPALDRVGILFQEGEYFLPDVLMSVKAYNSSYQMLESSLKEGDYQARGVVMLGTVEGDIHEIGKNILVALLQGNGFDVIDLGVNVTADIFLGKAKENNPDIIGMSALLTTTMPAMKDVIDLFQEEGMREQFRFIVGGAPLNQKFADEIGADGYGEDAQAGVELVKRLVES